MAIRDTINVPEEDKMSKDIIKRMMNVFIAITLIMSSLSVLVFMAKNVSAGPIVTLEITGQESGGSIESGDPGDDILFDVRIENNGDAIATINLTIIGTPNGWTTTLTGSDFTLSAGSHQVEILTVSIPANAGDTDSASITIKDTTNNKQDTCRVNVDQVYGLLFETANTIQSSEPDNTVTFTLPVNNTGNGIDTTAFTDTGAPPTWAVSYDSTKNLQPFTVADLVVAIYIPDGASTGTYSITLRGTSEDTVTYTTKTLTVTVTAVYGLSVSTLPSGNLDALPGGRVTYTLEISNIGNARDRFTLAVDDGNKSVGWTATLGTSTTPQVNAGDAYNVSLYVTAPINAKDSDQGKVNVTVASQNNASQNEMAYTITTILQERYLSLSVDNSSVEAPQGGTATFTFTVTNSGNGQDRIDITAIPPQGWSSPNISPTYFALASEATGQFTIVQTVPADALHEGFSLLVTAKSRDDEDAVTNSTVTVDVEQDFAVQVSIPGSNSKDVYPGNTETYNFTVKNKGNGEDTIDISQTGILAGWSWALSDSSVTLEAGAEETVRLTVTVPGDYENFGPMEVELIAVSDGDANAKDNSSKIIINIQKNYNVILTCKNANQKGYPEDTIYYIITITNDGNAEDLIEISIDAGDNADWSSVNETLYTLQPNAHSTVNLTVSIPVNQPAGYYYVNVTAKSKGAEDKGVDKSDTLATRTQVKPLYEVYLFADGGNVSEADAGDAVTYLLGVQNRGLAVDTFDMSFSGEFPFTNWVSMAYENYTITNLERNGIKKISFVVTIPADAHEKYPGITSGTVTISAQSRGDPTSTFDLGFKTTVKAKYDGSITTDNDFDKALPGDTVNYLVEVKNTGSAASDIFGLDEKDCPFDDVTITPSVAEINASDSLEFRIEVLIDEDANVGDFYFNLSLRSAGPDRILSKGDEVVATLQLKMEVLQNYGVRLTCSDRTDEIAPQEWTIYEVEVENEGNGEDTYDIEKYGNNTYMGWVTLETSTLTLEAGEVATVKVNISIPHSIEPMTFPMSINVTSRGNDSIVDRVELLTTVKQEFAIRLSSNDLNEETDPGAMVKYLIDVKNDGTGDDRIEVSIVTEGSDGAYSSWAEIPANMLGFDLRPGRSFRVTINVTPPEDQEVGDYKVVLKAESQNDPDGVTEKIITTTHVNPKRDVALEVTEDRKEVTPNLSGTKAKVSYSVKVTNKGTDKDNFKIEVVAGESDHASWVTRSTKTISSLDADGDATVTITVEIPNNQEPTGPDGFKTIIYVYSPGENSGTVDDIGTNVTLYTVIETAYGLELAASKKRKETGELESSSSLKRTLEFPFKVTNIGTGDDIVKLEIDDKPKGWDDISIDNETMDLAEDQSQTFRLTVNIDRDEPVGDYDIRIKVISRGDDTLYDEAEDIVETITFTVDVTAIHEIKVTALQTTKEGQPGESLTYTLTVKNKGNGDDTITVTLPDEVIKWGTRTVSPSSITLPSGESADVTITVKLSSDYSKALRGTYHTNITSTAGEGDEEYEVNVMLTTTITQEYALEIESQDWSNSGKIDNLETPLSEDVDFYFTVKNKGNGPDKFKFYLTGDKREWGTIEGGSTTDYLNAGEELEVKVVFTIGTDVEEYEAGDYSIGLRAISLGDDTVENIENSFSLEIEKVNLLELESSGQGDEEDLNPAEDSKLNFKIDITNSGNTDDKVSLTVKTKPNKDWTITILPASKQIARGDTETVTIEITPPDDVEERTNGYDIKIKAESEDDSVEYYEFKVNIKLPILQFDPDTPISFEDLNDDGKTVEAGKENVILIKLTNAGSADIEDKSVDVYDNDKLIGNVDVTLKPETTDIFRFEWVEAKVTDGKHKIKVMFTNEPSGDEEEEEISVEVEEEEKGEGVWEIATEGKAATLFYVLIAVVGFLLLFVIILILSRPKRPVPEEYKDEIAKARAEAEKEMAEEEEEKAGKKVKKEDIEKDLLKTKALPKGKAPAALPESTKKDTAEKTPAKRVKIKCPKCESIQTVTSTKRPLEFECEDCGMKLVLKK